MINANRSKTLKKSFKPNWNDYRVIQAMIELSSKALESQTTHVQFCTESCIPVRSLKECAKKLMLLEKDKYNMDCSFLDYYGRNDTRCTRFDERKRHLYCLKIY